MATDSITCSACGASLPVEPGTEILTCSNCNTTLQIGGGGAQPVSSTGQAMGGQRRSVALVIGVVVSLMIMGIAMAIVFQGR